MGRSRMSSPLPPASRPAWDWVTTAPPPSSLAGWQRSPVWRWLAEAARETLAGLSGLGDLVLTCTGPLSRNRSVGVELGRGHKLPAILAQLQGKVAEGVRTTSAALGLARAHHVEMPITEQMAAILEHGKSPQDAIRELMARPGRDE